MDILKEVKEEKEYELNNRRDIDDCSALIDTLQSISSAGKAVTECEELCAGSNIPAACRAVINMQSIVNTLPSENSQYGFGAAKVLYNECKLVKSRFNSRVRKLVYECIDISVGAVKVRSELKGLMKDTTEICIQDDASPIKLSELWEALAELGEMDDFVTHLVNQVWSNTALPLWKEKKYVPGRLLCSGTESELVFESIQSSQYGTSGSAAKTMGSTFHPPRMPFSQFLDSLAQIIAFVCTNVLLSSDSVRSIYTILNSMV